MRLRTKFQDEDFNLGEVVEANVYYGGNGRVKVIAEPAKGGMITFYFESLKGLNEMFEDAPEEPKEYWFINSCGVVEARTEEEQPTVTDRHRQFGNHFSSQEEAIKARERQLAWTRLKDKGFRFTAWYGGSKNISYEITSLENETYIPRQICDDLDLLFGGEK